MAEDQFAELWRPRRPDCRHAPASCGRAEMGQRAAVPPCAEFLHASSRAGGAAAHDISGLAASSCAWGCGGRRSVRPARRADGPAAEHGLCHLSAGDGCRGDLFRGQGGCAGHCDDGALETGPQSAAAYVARHDHTGILCRQFRVFDSLSPCHPRRRGGCLPCQSCARW